MSTWAARFLFLLLNFLSLSFGKGVVEMWRLLGKYIPLIGDSMVDEQFIYVVDRTHL